MAKTKKVKAEKSKKPSYLKEVNKYFALLIANLFASPTSTFASCK